MDDVTHASHNAAVRGYILRCLIKGTRFSALTRSLSNNLIASGLILEPDISQYLYYLQQCKLIAFTDKKVNAFNAYEKDAVITLTAKGIRLIEKGNVFDMGIDL